MSPFWEAASCVATQELKKFCAARRFSTLFKRARHWSLPCGRSNQSIPPHHITLRSILILCIHLRFGLPSGLPLISYMHSSSPHSCYMPCLSDHPWLDHSNYTWQRVQVMKLLIMQFSLSSCHMSCIILRSSLVSSPSLWNFDHFEGSHFSPEM
jgi:hypothetical protein